MKKLTVAIIAASLWFITSVILLTLPGSSIPSEKWLDAIWFDKWVHIGMFAVMVFLWCWVVVNTKLTSTKFIPVFLWITLAAIAYGVIMEFVQLYFIVGRSFDLKDMLADSIGAAIGFGFSRWRFIKK